MRSASVGMVGVVLLAALGGRAAAENGSLILRLEGKTQVRAAEAVDRSGRQRFPGAPDAEGSTWEFMQLPAGLYDVVLSTPLGTVEGVRMTIVDMLGRVEEPGGEHGTLSARSRRTIEAKVADLFGNKMFEDQGRQLAISGHGTEARVLVEKIRDRPTSLSSTEPLVFWRVEVWPFHYQYGGWIKGKYEVVVRRKLTRAQFMKLRWMFEPALGGVRVKAGERTELRYEVPESLDPAMSRVPRTVAGEPSPSSRP